MLKEGGPVKSIGFSTLCPHSRDQGCKEVLAFSVGCSSALVKTEHDSRASLVC